VWLFESGGCLSCECLCCESVSLLPETLLCMPFAKLHGPRKDQVIHIKVIDIRVRVQACCGAVDKHPSQAAALCREMLSSSPLPSSAPRKVMGGSLEDATIGCLGDGAMSLEDGAIGV